MMGRRENGSANLAVRAYFRPMKSRRHFLRAAGVTLALPALDSIGFRAFAAPRPVTPPKRLAFLYVPNGVNVAQWNPAGSGAEFTLSPTLEPLAGLKSEILPISNLRHESATWGEDGPGDHARATAAYLTGCRPRKTAGPDIRLGVSVDQIAAQHVGQGTRLPSLELSTDDARSSGKCDSGYSCAYQYNLSWKSPTQPIAAEQNPRAVFDRLFGAGGGARRSVIDAVRDDANDLKRRLGAEDSAKLDQFLDSVREVERRIQNAESAPDPAVAQFKKPAGIPDSYEAHIRAMFDLMALAFQTDSTRIITFMLAHDGSNHAFPEIGVPEAHHQISHHRDEAEKLAKIAKIDRFYTAQLAWFLEQLRAIPESNSSGTLLDHSMIVYGGCIKEGNKHSHEDLPIILAGRGGGTLEPGRHLVAPELTPMTNLYLSLVRRLGANIDRVGDSGGELAGLGPSV
jgi:hypothetical protein